MNKDADSQRFWRKVDFTGPSGCWNWTDALYQTGYGAFGAGTKSWLAHRFAYQESHGPLEPGLHLHHLCENKRCVRPAHLTPVTPQTNTAYWKATKTHCVNGHEFTEANTGHKFGGQGHYWQRRCRQCNREQERERRARKAVSGYVPMAHA